MKHFVILLFCIISINSVFSKEAVCESGSHARHYLTMRIQIVGLIPIPNEYENKHLLKMSGKLIPFMEELCQSESTSKEIAQKMRSKCVSLVKEIVGKNVKPYYDNCDLAFALAHAYIDGTENISTCENKNSISDLSRNEKQISLELKKLEKQEVKTK